MIIFLLYFLLVIIPRRKQKAMIRALQNSIKYATLASGDVK
jgi:hypothetical protein